MNSTCRMALVVLVAWASCARIVSAAVADSSESGFVLKLEAQAKAEPMKCYRGVTNSIGKWWTPSHTYSGDAANMYIEDRAGGCFCERLSGGGSVQHMRVVFSNPGSMLRLSGGLGPLQELAVTGSLTWEFTAEGEGTLVRLTYVVGGYVPGGLAGLAPLVDGVISQQFARFVSFVETGFPEPRE